MSKIVEIKIINKQPPAGRCRIYMDMAMVLMEAYRNVRMATVPDDQRDPSDPAPAAVLVNGRLLEPEDSVIVSSQEFIQAMEKAGGQLYNGTVPPVEKLDFVSKTLIATMGVTMVIGSLSGSIFSKRMSSTFLLAVFATMAVIAAIMMFVPRPEQKEEVDPEKIKFNKPAAALVGLSVGFFGGMVGAPGAFILIPIMIYLLKIPTRIVIGTTLGIVFLGALAGTIGKFATGQIVWPMALTLVAGTIPGARIGGSVSKKTKVQTLRVMIAVIIAITGLRMFYQVFTGR